MKQFIAFLIACLVMTQIIFFCIISKFHNQIKEAEAVILERSEILDIKNFMTAKNFGKGYIGEVYKCDKEIGCCFAWRFTQLKVFNKENDNTDMVCGGDFGESCVYADKKDIILYADIDLFEKEKAKAREKIRNRVLRKDIKLFNRGIINGT